MPFKWFKYEKYNENNNKTIMLFPHAGSAASFYAGWKKHFREDINVMPVQYPGRENRRRENIPNSISRMAKDFIQDNLDIIKRNKILLFGHCMGALICWEIAKILSESEYETSIVLFVSSYTAPDVGFDRRTNDMTEEDMLGYLCENGFINESLFGDKDFFEYYASIMRADLSLMEKYNYLDNKDIKIKFDIYTVNGKNDSQDLLDKVLYWKHYTEGCFRRILMEGGHFYLKENPEEVIRTIQSIFDTY